MSKDVMELWQGTTAGKIAGYSYGSGFKKARDGYPIPDQGYRVNGEPAWTREHLKAWRESIPKSGPKKSS